MRRWLVMVFCGLAWVAEAQSVRVEPIPVKDSALLIWKAPNCTSACVPYVIDWVYGATQALRRVPAKGADTLRVKRLAADVSAVATPYKRTTPLSVVVGGYQAPTAPSGPSYAMPKAPAPVVLPTFSAKRVVAVGSDLQAALNAAQPGDELVLPDSALYAGNYALPNKTDWVKLRAATVRAGRRDTALRTARIQSPNSAPALAATNGAGHWIIEGIEIEHKPGAAYNYGIVVLGSGLETTLAAMPSDIWLDRVYLHGSLNDGNSRCVAFNGARLAITHSWIGECHAKGFDAQGVGGWNGPGPFLIANSHIEASGQGVMFGGADPRVRDVLPSDITIIDNDLYKPLTWRPKWTVKAAFELKNGQRVVFANNVIDNHWADAQTGFAILFQTLADNNTSWEWTTVQDVLVQHNLIRNSTSGVNIAARVAYNGGPLPIKPTSRVVIDNNFFEHVGRDPITGAAGIGVQLMNDLQDVTIARNTFVSTLPMQKVLSFDARKDSTGWVAGQRTTIIDNIFPASSYHVTGNGTGPGAATLNAFMPGGLFARNVIPGAVPSLFPALGIGHAVGADTAAIRAATKR